MKQISEEDYQSLTSCANMLGRIGSHVEEFIRDDEDTVEVGVLRLLSQYYFMKSDEAHELMLKVQNDLRELPRNVI